MQLRSNSTLLSRPDSPDADRSGDEDRRRPDEGPRSTETIDTEEPLLRVVNELSHDLRQPLTSLNMNLQAAVRLLQRPTPHVEAALEALIDCLSTEHDMTALLKHAKRRVTALSSPPVPFLLNDLARDVLLAVRGFEPHWASRLDERLAEPSPLVSVGVLRLRLPLLSTIRRAMVLDEDERDHSEPIVVETYEVDHRAELRVTGLPAALNTVCGVQTALILTSTLMHALQGTVHLTVHNSKAVLVYSLPAALHFTDLLPGVDHGD